MKCDVRKMSHSTFSHFIFVTISFFFLSKSLEYSARSEEKLTRFSNSDSQARIHFPKKKENSASTRKLLFSYGMRNETTLNLTRNWRDIFAPFYSPTLVTFFFFSSFFLWEKIDRTIHWVRVDVDGCRRSFEITLHFPAQIQYTFRVLFSTFRAFEESSYLCVGGSKKRRQQKIKRQKGRFQSRFRP